MTLQGEEGREEGGKGVCMRREGEGKEMNQAEIAIQSSLTFSGMVIR